jgi:hypothetical protein
MSSRKTPPLSNELKYDDANDVLAYTQLPPDSHRNVAEYPPRSKHGQASISSSITSPVGLSYVYDPEQARWHTPPDSSEPSISTRTLSETKPRQVVGNGALDTGGSGKVREPIH